MENVCGCKGVRSCLICEAGKQTKEQVKPNDRQVPTEFHYCEQCKKAWRNDNSSIEHPHHGGESIDFPGVTMLHNFVTAEEEDWLDQEINKTTWAISQSGRRKQDYGPKVNFKKKKLKTSSFTGLPSFSESLVNRMQGHEILQNFIPVELCNLEYIPVRGSAIDSHFDDFWVWGERLVTLNLLSPTAYSMTIDSRPDVVVNIPFPQRSLIVMYGPARYQWKHGIDRTDIHRRRLGLTFRELTPEFLPGGPQADVGEDLIKTALTYEGTAVGLVSPNETACR